MNEIWKPIPGYEGRYEVSNQGNVRGRKGILAPNKMTNGYLCVHLYSGGKHTRRPLTIHKLVAITFLPSSGLEINHINFDRADNRLANIEWVTHVYNVQHTIKAGRQADVRRPVIATSVHTKQKIAFSGQRDAEILLRGKQTGRVSQAIRSKKPAYGFAWGAI